MIVFGRFLILFSLFSFVQHSFATPKRHAHSAGYSLAARLVDAEGRSGVNSAKMRGFKTTSVQHALPSLTVTSADGSISISLRQNRLVLNDLANKCSLELELPDANIDLFSFRMLNVVGKRNEAMKLLKITVGILIAKAHMEFHMAFLSINMCKDDEYELKAAYSTPLQSNLSLVSFEATSIRYFISPSAFTVFVHHDLGIERHVLDVKNKYDVISGHAKGLLLRDVFVHEGSGHVLCTLRNGQQFSLYLLTDQIWLHLTVQFSNSLSTLLRVTDDDNFFDFVIFEGNYYHLIKTRGGNQLSHERVSLGSVWIDFSSVRRTDPFLFVAKRLEPNGAQSVMINTWDHTVDILTETTNIDTSDSSEAFTSSTPGQAAFVRTWYESFEGPEPEIQVFICPFVGYQFVFYTLDSNRITSVTVTDGPGQRQWELKTLFMREVWQVASYVEEEQNPKVVHLFVLGLDWESKELILRVLCVDENEILFKRSYKLRTMIPESVEKVIMKDNIQMISSGCPGFILAVATLEQISFYFVDILVKDKTYDRQVRKYTYPHGPLARKLQIHAKNFALHQMVNKDGIAVWMRLLYSKNGDADIGVADHDDIGNYDPSLPWTSAIISLGSQVFMLIYLRDQELELYTSEGDYLRYAMDYKSLIYSPHENWIIFKASILVDNKNGPSFVGFLHVSQDGFKYEITDVPWYFDYHSSDGNVGTRSSQEFETFMFNSHTRKVIGVKRPKDTTQRQLIRIEMTEFMFHENISKKIINE